MGERTPREGIRVWELIVRESADFTLLIIGNPGALVRFLTTSLGCYSLRRSCNLSVVRWLNVESPKYDFDG